MLEPDRAGPEGTGATATGGLARKVGTVGAATLGSRLLAFLRDAGIAALLGAGPMADAYFAALQVPNLFRRLLAEGALNGAFVPLWLRLRETKGRHAVRAFGEGALGAMAAGLGLATLLLIAAAPAVVHVIAPGFSADGARFDAAVSLVRLSAPYVAIAGCVAVLGAILNAEGRVTAVAFGPIVFNGVLIAAVAGLLLGGPALTAQAGAVLAIAIVVAGLGQTVLIGSAARRLPAHPRRPRLAADPELRRLFALAGPGLLAGGIPQITLMAGAMIASPSPAAVSWLYYADRLYEFPLGVVSVAIAAVMGPAIAGTVRTGTAAQIAAAQGRAMELALGLALPSMVGFVLLAEPIARALFERGAFSAHDTAMVSAALAALASGLPGHVAEKVLGAISFAREDTRTPMWTALGGLAASSAAALALFPHHGHVGVAAGIAAGGYVAPALLALVLARRGWLRFDPAAATRIPRIVLAAVVTGIVVLAARTLTDAAGIPSGTLGRFAVLLALLAAGLGTYVAMLGLLRIVRPTEIAAALRRGPRRPA
ncbi:murein biosynthesis integral membrane protein MurJ [Rhodoplanes sp. TEM]|uniref:Probable lipid II flippase MurJ n=1 Tax=Rhodoplanes tepidamans TaxID=200616 RepID=A0ABT5JFF2_RHOTP|nr:MULTISPECIES: murein biosynthesis integral membrane protein MurJ [Rhodoplanes]MDC7788440.1 murein biosynthesis integral membrane protein MurJ [Rhodoplanes tepidamans]MDC7983585.1 murein biosynthesis integral membrane protein MurJ [Rhodoplanes sp. TEM]MDQ0354173.1 putative peptidoglycan lipid II flippase [Rhodoplanes tepidamans]